MPPAAVAVPALATEPGFLFYAPLGTTLPTNTVTGSVFTDAWPVGFVALGATDDGSAFNWQTTTDKIEAAEFLDPIAWKTTGREGSLAFALMSIHAQNIKRALNGGTLVTTGTGATSMTTLTPPLAGAEVRCILGWESQDSTERLIIPQAFNSGALQIARRKGVNKATLACEFKIELPASGVPFSYYTAGVARLGV